LLGVNYIDKVLDASSHTESRSNVTISSETDRVYAAIPQDTTSVLDGTVRRFDVVRDNLPDTVIWNPWIEKANAMGDFKPKDGYKNMVCVEVGNVGAWIKLDGGETWEGGQVMKSYL
jgi:glucose-6-phosphate 1-epimerase